VLVELMNDLRALPGPREGGGADYGGVVVPMRLETPVGTLQLFSTTTVFGTPVDVTLSELAIEAFYPGGRRNRRGPAPPHGAAGRALTGRPRPGRARPCLVASATSHVGARAVRRTPGGLPRRAAGQRGCGVHNPAPNSGDSMSAQKAPVVVPAGRLEAIVRAIFASSARRSARPVSSRAISSRRTCAGTIRTGSA
jgi:hypothetical protein